MIGGPWPGEADFELQYYWKVRAPPIPPFRPPKNSRISEPPFTLSYLLLINFGPNCFKTWILFLRSIMPRYTKGDLARAIKNVANGKAMTVAAPEWSIPYSTLQDRIQGSENYSNVAESQRNLSRGQEGHLANWVLTREALGVPLTHAQIKEFG
jgi:hypothetical protein